MIEGNRLCGETVALKYEMQDFSPCTGVIRTVYHKGKTSGEEAPKFALIRNQEEFDAFMNKNMKEFVNRYFTED